VRSSWVSSRLAGELAGVSDRGQILKPLSRLEGLGLLQNTGGHTQGLPNAWALTPRGQEIVSLSPDRGDYPSAYGGGSRADANCPVRFESLERVPEDKG